MSNLDKRTYVEGFIPEVGQRIIASARLCSEPEAYNVISFSKNDRGIDVIHFKLDRLNHESSTHLSDLVFYPEVPLDSVFTYEVVKEEYDCNDRMNEIIVGYCFTPEEAMDLSETLEKETKISHRVVLIRMTNG